jgi:hypothetical protein
MHVIPPWKGQTNGLYAERISSNLVGLGHFSRLLLLYHVCKKRYLSRDGKDYGGF